ncbi:MAG: DNA-formamidopyrimidine glycosylase family protein [Dehalococcoidia bacterium]
MPELPEVESLRRYLTASGMCGRTIAAVEARWPGIENSLDGMGGLAGLPGRRMESIHRHGKQLLVILDRGVLGLHMGMTGSLVVRHPEDEPLKYAHTTLFLDDERRIELTDPRRWASVVLAGHATELTGGLGPDALDPDFTADSLIERLSGRRMAIKPLLLDQRMLAGVGNIYADEALHRAGISPLRRTNRISRERLARLHAAIRETLESATEYIVAHPVSDGRPLVVDAYDGRMMMPRRRGEPCPSCGHPIRSHAFNNRTAYYCPACQR